jgi:hypothetical protein
MSGNIDIKMLLVWTLHLFEGSHRRFVGGYYRHSGWNGLCPGRNLRTAFGYECWVGNFKCHGTLPSVLTEKRAGSALILQNLYIINIVTEYTGCPRTNVTDFGRVFLMLKYTDITQNTYIQTWTVTEIMAREKCGLLAVPHTVPVRLTLFPYIAHVLESGMQCNSIQLDIYVPCKVLGTLRTTTALVRVFM